MESQPSQLFKVKAWVAPIGRLVPAYVAVPPGQANKLAVPVEVGYAATFTVTIESQPSQLFKVKAWVAPIGRLVPAYVAVPPGQANKLAVPVDVGYAATFTVTMESQPSQVVKVKFWEVPVGTAVPA